MGATYKEEHAGAHRQTAAGAEGRPEGEARAEERPETGATDAGAADTRLSDAGQSPPLDEVAIWKAKAEENYDRFLRARAELENYQRRMARDLAAMVRRGKKDLVLGILEVMDNFDRALSSVKDKADAASVRSGVEMIYRQLEAVLAREGVRPMETVGKPFDPGVHEAVAAWEKDDIDTEMVTDEIRRGYTYDDEVLRAARVRVARPTSRGGPAQG